MNSRMIFWNDQEVKSPKANLAINDFCTDLIRNETHDLIARVYRHSKGVILGNNESNFDVNSQYCDANGYEITSRPTGGSAIIVAPDLNISYSVFFNKKQLDKKNIHDIYKSITIPLAKNLGKKFSVQGNYYLRYELDGMRVPVAGHAMKSHQDVMQFDGVIQLRKFSSNEIDELLNLRELWEKNNQQYLRVNNDFYTLDGKKIFLDKFESKLLRSEKVELEKIIGLEDVGLNSDDFTKIFRETLDDNFGKLYLASIQCNSNIIKKYISKQNNEFGSRKFLGHCFVDLVDVEQEIVYPDN